MKIKCNCGEKIEIEEIKKDEPIKIVCPVCEREIVINDTKSLLKKYTALLVIDVFFMVCVVLCAVLLFYTLNFRISWGSVVIVIGLFSGLVALWDKKIALRIIGTVVIASSAALLIWLSMPKYSSPKDFLIFIETPNNIVIKSYRGGSEVISIPPKIKKIKVTAIGDKAFKGNTQFPVMYQHAWQQTRRPGGPMLTPSLRAMSVNNLIISVILPDTIESIGTEAFAFTTFLSDITIPNTVTTIGDRAFQESGITFIEIPDSVRSIGRQAFCSSSPLEYFKVEGPFTGNKLKTIVIGSNVELNDSFENGFDDFYIKNGRRAGAYTLNNDDWIFEVDYLFYLK